MKTTKKIALLALAAIVGYTGYSFSAISIKERDALKKQADTLINEKSPNADQLDKLENILMKLERTEKYNRFARKERNDVMFKLLNLRANEAKSKMNDLEAKLSGAHKVEVQSLNDTIAQLTQKINKVKNDLKEEAADCDKIIKGTDKKLEKLRTDNETLRAANENLRLAQKTHQNAIQVMAENAANNKAQLKQLLQDAYNAQTDSSKDAKIDAAQEFIDDNL